MDKKVFVYDPTASDTQSAVRGIGRYLQILKENFPDWTFSSSLTPNPYSLTPIFINPFFNFLQPTVRTSHDLSLLGRRIAKKQIAIIHDLIPLKYPSHFPAGIKGSIYILLNKFALRNYDLIITDSEASKKDIVNILHIREDKIKVIYPCLPKSFAQKYPNPYSLIPNPYCLYVGDATWNKNLVNLARAIKIANVTCVFVGKVFDKKYQRSNIKNQNGKLNIKNESNETMKQFNNDQTLSHPWNLELKQFFKETINDKRFIFAGFVPDSDLIKLYQQSLFNILPSHDEGFGFSYLEASQFGCPSLLSDIPVLREISAGNAIFFDQNNPQDIANKIIGFVKKVGVDPRVDPGKNKLGNMAKKRSEFFSAKKFKQEFLSVV